MQILDLEKMRDTFCFPWSTPQTTLEKWKGCFAEQQKGIRTVYLLEMEGELIGYGSLLYVPQYPLFKNSGIPEIHDVWVSEKWRNKGFGKKLILHFEAKAREKKYQQIGLAVGLYKDYGSAQRLYFLLGYQPDGQGITYKCQPVIPGQLYPVDDELVLWLKKQL